MEVKLIVNKAIDGTPEGALEAILCFTEEGSLSERRLLIGSRKDYGSMELLLTSLYMGFGAALSKFMENGEAGLSPGYTMQVSQVLDEQVQRSLQLVPIIDLTQQPIISPVCKHGNPTATLCPLCELEKVQGEGEL